MTLRDIPRVRFPQSIVFLQSISFTAEEDYAQICRQGHGDGTNLCRFMRIADNNRKHSAFHRRSAPIHQLAHLKSGIRAGGPAPESGPEEGEEQKQQVSKTIDF
jgi:hypothetical protein